MNPHIVLIDCHDLGTWLGCYSQSAVHTPALDRLAASGARCTNFFAVAPQCIPSRVGLYSSQIPHAVGCHGQNPPLSPPRYLGSWLGELGYDARLCGSFQVCSPAPAAGYGQVCGGEPTAANVQTLLPERIERPLFLHISFGKVHRPFGQNYDPSRLAEVSPPAWLPDTVTVRRDLLSLSANVEALDAAIDEILALLYERLGRQNMLVAFTTDHGPALGRSKHTLYDAGLRTALLLSYPGRLTAGTTCPDLISNLDFFPTVLELAGLPAPTGLQGHSFARTLTEGVAFDRDTTFSAISWTRRSGQLSYHPSRAVRTRRHKFIRNFTSTPNYLDGDWLGRMVGGGDPDGPLTRPPNPPCELYDLAQDPAEQHNRVLDPAQAEIRRDLDQRLSAILSTTNDPVLSGRVPNVTGEPEKPQWLPDPDGRYRLNYQIETETPERPFPITATAADQHRPAFRVWLEHR